MIKYEPKSKQQMEMISGLHKQIQGTIILLANKKISNELIDELKGIFKCEGGVTVNGKEICIKDDYVKDDWTYDMNPIPEEQAVVDVINELFGAVDFTDQDSAIESVKKFIEEKLNTRDQLLVERYCGSPFAGNNLISFFQVM